MAEILEHPCLALLHAAEKVLAAETDEQMSEALVDLAVAADQLRRRLPHT